MAVTKRSAKSDAAVAAKAHAALDEVADAGAAGSSRQGRGKLPAVVQFPIAAAMSFVIASLGYSAVGELSKGELASVTRSQDTWEEVAVLAGWRMLATQCGAGAGVATFTNADNAHLYLLTTFYSLSPATALSALTVNVLSAALPFYLLRPLSDVHRPSAKIANRELIDLPLQLYTTALSTGIYTVVLVLSLRFLLPRILVVYFTRLPSLEPAYTATYAAVLPVTVLFGAAASTFIFAPFATTGESKDDDKIGQFDPVQASLQQTVWWNFWGYTAKTKVVIRRTAAAVFVTGISTYLACTMSIYGIESTGAIAYAAVWVFAALCTGLGLGLVGGD
ncbi:hypothetical protein TOPH_00689 [Tolypocladium ophioglossoides CBS 100239]|uniref:Uncharacterized protein n=1 Tax=Tolypocladium ophioglossoides (strain CBS 100239) TaxID=1163406 RepID=A0A0L0NL05_TOLOC|nr:hypothetical protein TOPH_00689 [Tolypocladium ophioglossoides CBS 100239]